MNCMIIDDSEVVRKQLEGFISKTDDLECMGSYENPLDALKRITEEVQLDLLFLDIELPDMSGLELLDNLNTSPEIIIISSKDIYAVSAFDYDVTDYLLKPISYSRFYKSVQRAMNALEEKAIEKPDANKYKTEFFIKENDKFIKIQVTDILFIKASGNYLSLHTFDKRHLIHSTMKSINNKLDPDKFIRVHRSFFVNLNMISSITGNTILVQLKNEKYSIPIGKIYKNDLMSKINLMK